MSEADYNTPSKARMEEVARSRARFGLKGVWHLEPDEELPGFGFPSCEHRVSSRLRGAENEYDSLCWSHRVYRGSWAVAKNTIVSVVLGGVIVGLGSPGLGVPLAILSVVLLSAIDLLGIGEAV